MRSWVWEQSSCSIRVRDCPGNVALVCSPPCFCSFSVGFTLSAFAVPSDLPTRSVGGAPPGCAQFGRRAAPGTAVSRAPPRAVPQLPRDRHLERGTPSWCAGHGRAVGRHAWVLMSPVLFQSPDAADDLRYVDDRNNSGKLVARGLVFVLPASQHGSRGFPFASLWNQPRGLQLLAA